MQSTLGPNLVQNASFENGWSHWNTSNAAKVVSGAAHSGGHSLYYNNTNAKQYKMFSQKVNVKPGQTVRFSVWIKGENIKGQGASLYMQSYKGSQYLTGSFPGRFKGTFGWKKVTSTYKVVPGTTSTTIGLYLRKGTTGKVWFDDVSVRLVSPPALNSSLLYPNYRGMAVQGDNTPWKVQVNVNKPKGWENGGIKVISAIVNNQGAILFARNSEISTASKHEVMTVNPPRNLPLGQYTLKQTFILPDGTIESTQYTVDIVKEMPKVYVDPQGFTVVNGARFFPFGFYIGGGTSDAQNLQRIADGGFNTVLSYQYGVGKNPKAYMQAANQYGLKVVYSIKDLYPGKHGNGDDAFKIAAKYIKQMRNQPALLAWYTNDELGTGWLKKLTVTYDLVKKLDPNHPAMMVQNKASDLKADAAVTDILASDPYPVGSGNLSSTSRRTKAVIQAANGAKGVWMVPQSMDWAVYRKNKKQHRPSLDEMRNQAYQAIINGAKGLIFYSYYDMMFEDYPRSKATTNMKLFAKRWRDCVAMAKEINKVIPVILQNRKVALKLPKNALIQAGAWQDGNQLLILLANPYYKQESITFAIPQGWVIQDDDQGQIKSSVSGRQVTFNLPSVGSGVFHLERQ